jgi:Tol biopolymer transport system component
MSMTDRFDRDFSQILSSLADPQFPDYFDDTLAQAVNRRQRPAWTFPERWLPMEVLARRPVFVPALPWRTAGLLLLLGLLLAATLFIMAGSQLRPAPPFGPARNGLVTYSVGGDVYTRDLATNEARLIAGGPEVDLSPSFSRDGTKLVYVRLSDDPKPFETLMVANIDGSAAHAAIGPIRPRAAALSPDGTEVAIISEQRQLSIAAIDGSGARSIPLPTVEADGRTIQVLPEGGVEWRPPDGGELVFLGRADPWRAIYAIRPDGTGFRQLTPQGTTDSYFTPFGLSPDGGRLAYTSGVAGVHLHILDIETGADRQFGAALPPPATEGPIGVTHEGFASFSPDGEQLVFGRYWDERDRMINHQAFVASANGDGADAHAVGPLIRSPSGQNPFQPLFAPDGSQIIIEKFDTGEVWLADPAGTSLEPVDWGELMDPPDWQRLAP